MNEKECKSVLNLDYLYFSEMQFIRTKDIGQTTLDINYEIKHEIADDVANVKIETTINSQNESLKLKLVTTAQFSLIDEANQYDAKAKEDILRYNTVAIIMPYIRSQVSIITTQPDMNPIMLQPIDVTRLMENNKKK
ncbi:MAG: hypothetical protein HFE46_07260 [Clostridia bacterium]|nr:hypothetical protein [Clostridia bacterium]